MLIHLPTSTGSLWFLVLKANNVLDILSGIVCRYVLRSNVVLTNLKLLLLLDVRDIASQSNTNELNDSK